jgi:hypothetical protein
VPVTWVVGRMDDFAGIIYLIGEKGKEHWGSPW